MKDRILNFDEITNSTELYNQRVKPVAYLFTYILTAIFTITIIFIAHYSVETVIKSYATVRPNEQINTIKTLLSAEVSEINYQNGDNVSEGDVLIVLNHDTQLLSKERIEETILENTNNLNNLNKYVLAIEQDANLFDEATEKDYYSKFESFKLQKQINNDNIDADKKLTAQDTNIIQNNINTSTEQLLKYEAENEIIAQTINSIKNKEMLISSDLDTADYYKTLYNKYILDYISTDTALSTYIKDIYGYTLIKNSIDSNINLFNRTTLEYSTAELKIYENSYNTYILATNELKKTVDELTEKCKTYEPHRGVLISINEYDQMVTERDAAINTYETYLIDYYNNNLSLISSAENNVLILSDDSATSYNLDLENVQFVLLNQLETDNIMFLEDKLNSNLAAMKSLENNVAQYQIEKNRVSINTNGYTQVELLITNELNSSLNEIKILEQNLTDLNAQLKQIDTEITNSIIKANQSGHINIMEDLTVGDIIWSGTNILTIVPLDDTDYKMDILIYSKDIANVEVGSEIKYSFESMPYREYGQLTGTVTQVSVDSLQSGESSVYRATATLNETFAQNKNGNILDVKIGMVAEAQVITGKKTLLRLLLEKINLMD